ncbi:hypothetical protein CTI12_AA399350 [Artemisia annua]|uniref:CRAL-TRIO domain-containing protein n=1 Tax=Artemisia annua TaxID=35608 RepID=A0A2U1MAQ4_ARTAN|nr:hypothetical protein CTI12_AA399350 [Artemisia annua]
MKIVNRGGVDSEGRPVMVVVGAHFLLRCLDLERFVLHVLKKFEPVIQKAYSIVYFHSATSLQVQAKISALSFKISANHTYELKEYRKNYQLMVLQGTLMLYKTVQKPETSKDWSEIMDYFQCIGCTPSVAMNPADFLLDLANGIISNNSSQVDKSAVKQHLFLAYKPNLDENLKAETLDAETQLRDVFDHKNSDRWSTTRMQKIHDFAEKRYERKATRIF